MLQEQVFQMADPCYGCAVILGMKTRFIGAQDMILSYSSLQL